MNYTLMKNNEWKNEKNKKYYKFILDFIKEI